MPSVLKVNPIVKYCKISLLLIGHIAEVSDYRPLTFLVDYSGYFVVLLDVFI